MDNYCSERTSFITHYEWIITAVKGHCTLMDMYRSAFIIVLYIAGYVQKCFYNYCTLLF